MQGAQEPMILSEIAALWNNYISDKAFSYVFKHFLENVDDDDIRSVIKYALELSEQHVSVEVGIMRKEGLPVPVAFSEEDFNKNSPRLFTDPFYLLFLHHMASFGSEGYAQVLRYVARIDIRDLYLEYAHQAEELYRQVLDLQLAKGVIVKVPRVEVKKEPIFPRTHMVFKGIMQDHPRQMFALEVTNLFGGSVLDTLIRSVATAFGQAAQAQPVKDYMDKGRDIASRHFQAFRSKLNKENIPSPAYSESFVTDSKIPPFSDRLMMFIIEQVLRYGLVLDAAATVSSMRTDITFQHAKFGAEISKYAKEGLKIMIDREWFEQPPQVSMTQ